MDNQIKSFLDIIFKDTLGNIELRAIDPTRGLVDRIFTRSMSEIDSFVSRHVSTTNIYYGVCTRKLGDTEGKKENTFEITSFWADMDFKDYGQEAGRPIDLKKGEEIARKILSDFPCPPSATVVTGGGIQVYWFFEPQVIAEIEVLEAVLKEISRWLKSDKAVAEVARPLRLPGTINFPNMKKMGKGGRVGPLRAFVEHIDEARYNFDDFSSFFKGSEKNRKEHENKKTKNQNIQFEDLEEKLNFHLEKDILLNATWHGNRSDYKDTSRSGHDMALASSLARLKFTQEETKSILKKFPFGKKEDGSESYFDVTVSKAYCVSKKNAKLSEKPPGSDSDTESLAVFEKILSEINKTPELIEMSEVEESDPKFLVEPQILADASTLLGGDGGCGKSQIAIAYAAQVSLRGRVCIFSNEDKPSTIKKRLKNQGANYSNIFHCRNAFDLSSHNGQLLMIKFFLKKQPLFAIVDSLASYSGNKDLNKSGDVRQIINFLNEVARYFNCAVLVICHLNKGDGKAIYKISGSTQIVAAARSVLLAGCKPKEDENSEEDRIGAIFHVKANESKMGKPIGYSLGDNGLTWIENKLTEAEILSSYVAPKATSSATDEARKFLEDTLLKGPQKISEIKDLANNLGIAPATLRRAKDSLKIKSYTEKSNGSDKPSGFWKLNDYPENAFTYSMINDQADDEVYLDPENE